MQPQPQSAAPVDLTSLEGRTVCEVYTRVMGYHRPVAYWNTGKKQEHKDRKAFIIDPARYQEK